MEVNGWKPGQTCRWNGEWATVSYVLPNGRVIVTTDDGRQGVVSGEQLTDPVVRAEGSSQRRAR